VFRKILIANRGEIALRVICACKEMGIGTVAIFSEADRHALHVRFADEAICVGPPRPGDSYLNVPAVVSAAEITNVDAIHPGYGFLSENANFAEVCEASGLKFIGPKASVIRLMGEKERAREAAKAAGLPVLPGSDGVLRDEADAVAVGRQVGYPVMVKASAGGGGRGMRVVRTAEEMPGLFSAAQTEAANAFGCGDLYLEKLVVEPRHIEFQVLGDEHGRVIHLSERECSVQRRHQKLIEESPAVPVTPELRRKMGRVITEAMQRIGYTNAGTIEFLMDRSGELYFIEMNTRLQVEHPVTEMVTGVDLVKAQIRIAAGEPLEAICQVAAGETGLLPRGHAIECRINAENPETFTPSAGKVTGLNLPGSIGVRVDAAVYAEGVVPPYYDSLVAKLIASGSDRSEAIARLQRALDMFVVQGIETSIPLHKKILAEEDFRAGRLSTAFMDRFMPQKSPRRQGTAS
jgi:acetyl-CoA carboxylase biotin carboxylase subunit